MIWTFVPGEGIRSTTEAHLKESGVVQGDWRTPRIVDGVIEGDVTLKAGMVPDPYIGRGRSLGAWLTEKAEDEVLEQYVIVLGVGFTIASRVGSMDIMSRTTAGVALRLNAAGTIVGIGAPDGTHLGTIVTEDVREAPTFIAAEKPAAVEADATPGGGRGNPDHDMAPSEQPLTLEAALAHNL